MRRKVNDSDPIKLTIPSEGYRGNKRNQISIYNPSDPQVDNRPMDLINELAYVANPQNEVMDEEGTSHTIMRTRNLYITVDRNKMFRNGVIPMADTANVVPNININLPKGKRFLTKDELAVMDVVASNIHDRPIYFAVTCKNDKLLGLNDYMQMEGLGLRVIPVKTPSIRNLSIYGSGRVASEKAYNNIINKWRWGNFDNEDLYVDNSYAAEIQAMKIVMMRTAEELMDEGKTEKAAEMSKRYFKSFPHMNFAYDESVVPFIKILIETGEKAEAKKHLGILAEETSQKLRFFDSVDEDDFESFRQDYGYAIRAVSEILETSKQLNDPELSNKIQQDLGSYDLSKLRN